MHARFDSKLQKTPPVRVKRFFSARRRGWPQPLRAKAPRLTGRRADTRRRFARVGDVVQRAAVEDEEVRTLTRLQRADVGEMQPFRRSAGCGDDDLSWRHPGRHHVLHLDVMGPWNVAVRSQRYFDACGVEPLQVPRLVFLENRLNSRAVVAAS